MIQNAADIDIHRKISVNNHLTIFYLLTLILGLPALPARAQYAGGNGDPNTPFLIADPNHLNAIGLHPEHFDKHFKLTADIDLARFAGSDFNIIGTLIDWNDPGNKPFTGVFDGNNHVISNFCYISSTELKGVGLFAFINDQDALIKDLILLDPQINDPHADYVGSVAGYLFSGTLQNCSVDNGNTVGDNSVGNLVGRLVNGTITKASATGFVSGNSNVGGLVGNNAGSISHSFAHGEASGDGSVGGLVGQNHAVITHSYAAVNVFADQYLGGLVGSNNGSISLSFATGEIYGSFRYAGGLAGYNKRGLIINCYAKGNVNGNMYVGGLVGYNTEWSIVSCSYAVGAVSGSSSVGGLVGKNYNYAAVDLSFWDVQTSQTDYSSAGLGKNTKKMMSTQTFHDWIDQNAWTIDHLNDYPHLAWENAGGVPLNYLPFFPAGGEGTAADPFLIANPQQLDDIGLYPELWHKHFKLTDNIDLTQFNGMDFNLIGNFIDWEHPNNRPFTGVFDGDHYSISNFKYSVFSEKMCVGLFAYVNDANASIRNVTLTDPNIYAPISDYVGGLVGRIVAGNLENCSSDGGFIRANDYVGQLAGAGEFAAINNCCANGTVNGSSSIGGLIGGCYIANLSSCHALGCVNGQSYVGGLVGEFFDGGIITNSYADVATTGSNKVGGLVGNNYYGAIANCCASGDVSGYSNVGGLTGANDNGAITNSSAAGNVIGRWSVGGLTGSQSAGTSANSYATGQVQGIRDYVGGLVGSNDKSYISYSYASGKTTGKDNHIGGLVGDDSLGIYHKNFWDITVNPILPGIGNITDPNVTAESTANLKKTATFTCVGWDFVGDDNGDLDFWRMCVDDVDYPKLSWQFPAGDLLCPDGVGILDLAYWAAHWLDGNCDTSNNHCRRSDLNRDGRVDLGDYNMLAANWLKGLIY